MNPIRITSTLIGVALGATLLIGIGAATAQEESPDDVRDGEQKLGVAPARANSTREAYTKMRRAIARMDGVAEVSGETAIIIRPEPNSNLSYAALEAKINEIHGSDIVRAPRLGFDLTVDFIFNEEHVTEEQVPEIIDAMYSTDELTSVEYAGGRKLRVKTAPWSLRNQRGFNAMDLVSPAARATGYRGPGAPTFDHFISDIVFQPTGTGGD